MLNPSLRRLMLLLMRARLRRAVQRFRQPRRLVLSVLAVVLAGIWFGQALLGILFRSAADPERLVLWLPMGFTAYASWHVLKSCIQKPVEPFEWTPTECEMLRGAPLTRPELVRYRLAGIFLPATMKSICFALVMIPDLRVWCTGFLGMFLALLAIDLVRMLAEITAYGVSKRTFLWMRIAGVAVAAGLGLRILVPVIVQPKVMSDPNTWAVLSAMFGEVVAWASTVAGQCWLAPFSMFGDIILARSFGLELVAKAGVAVISVGALMLSVRWLDDMMWRRRIARERRTFPPGFCESRSIQTPAGKHGNSRWWQPPKLDGVASLAWRQFRGARGYGFSVLVAMTVPALLSLLPMFGQSETRFAVLQMVGSLVFYSLVLLPAAFKFDFRRDLDRIVVLKSLPLRPRSVVLGQLAVPVLLCTAFQAGVMLLAMGYRPFSWLTMFIAISVMAAANVLIFALENLVFLLYPYRLNKEGVDVFLRSIIVLTAKSLLFGFGLATTIVWALMANQLCGAGTPAAANIFFAGMMATLLAGSAILFQLLVGVYDRFDPSQDVPAMS